jgi:predicted secreted protein
MDFVSGLVVYILLWWWVFLMSLPFGVRPPAEIEQGHATSAPAKPMLWRKMAASTLIAVALFAVAYLVIRSGVISFQPA